MPLKSRRIELLALFSRSKNDRAETERLDTLDQTARSEK